MVNKEIIDRLIEYFDNSKPYSIKNGMHKVEMMSARDIISEFFDFDSVHFHGGNFYQHSKPYYPHIDGHPHWGRNGTIMVIPLRYEGKLPHLVVFDQRYKKGQITWTNGSEIKFVQNKSGSGRPYDTGLSNPTDKPIDDNLYQYLTHIEKDFWYGLSGKAYPFKPGNVISFSCYQVHATSSMEGIKLGLTLRYTPK